MKEEDLKKHLDNILIDGIIKEAEQDNADFLAAMRKISDNAFDEILQVSVPDIQKRSTRFKVLRPWITAVASAAAIIIIVLVPSFNTMNDKLCDSAYYMSEAYITASKGGLDLSTATAEQIKENLPSLEARYEDSCRNGKFTEDFPDAAWNLAVAYLKLHKKKDAINVLKALEVQTKGTPMGIHCEKLLQQLN